nr:putative integron gene cassette protein [uncultured bacterium]
MISSVSRQKAVCSFVVRSGGSSASVGVALRARSRRVCSSVRFVWRAHTLHALRFPASVAMIGLRSVLRSRCGRFGDGRRRVLGARSGTWASVFGKCVGARFASASTAV